MASFHSVWAHMHVQEQTAWRAVVSSNPITGSSLPIRQLFVGGEDLLTHRGAGSSGGVAGAGRAWLVPAAGWALPASPFHADPRFAPRGLVSGGLLGMAMGKAILQGMVSSYSVLGGRPETPLSRQQGCSV